MNEQEHVNQRLREMLNNQVLSYEKFLSKFTERARKALVLADEEAALLHHNYIGTEHLLLGLLSEGSGVAARVLNELGIELQAVRAVIEHIVGPGSPEEADGTRPMTPRAQIVLTMAVGETWRSSYVGTEHLLLGIVREGEGLAAAAIENLGVTLEQVRMNVFLSIIHQSNTMEPLKEIVKTKTNVVTCRINDQDLDALDALVEVGIRSTRSDAASWLIHAGITANQPILETVYATVAEIRSLRTKAQALVQQARNKAIMSSAKSDDQVSISSTTESEQSAG